MVTYMCADATYPCKVKICRKQLSCEGSEFRSTYLGDVRPSTCSSHGRPSQRQIQLIPTFVVAVAANKFTHMTQLTELLQARDNIFIQGRRSVVNRAKDTLLANTEVTWEETFFMIAPLLKAFRTANSGSHVCVDLDD